MSSSVPAPPGHPRVAPAGRAFDSICGAGRTMAASDLDALRRHLLELLDGGHAHPDFEAAIAGLPADLRGAKPPGLPHTPWRLLEHMRIAQWDILRFSIDPDHVSPEFPSGYWPDGDAPPDPAAWDRSVEAFRADLRR